MMAGAAGVLPGTSTDMRLTQSIDLLRRCLRIGALIAGSTLLACSGGRELPEGMPSPGAEGGFRSIGGGQFQPLGEYSNLYGRAQVLRSDTGGTSFALHVEGLAAEVDYPAHVHVYPCEVDNAGGHYKIDPAVNATIASNELWPALRTNAQGIGRASLTVPHAARMDAQSIVLHDPNNGNVKMACANLQLPAVGPVVRGGSFAAFASAESLDAGIGGAIQMISGTDRTQVTGNLHGLDAATEYRSHIHSFPCQVVNAGGHYKIDPTIEATEEANELWPVVIADENGEAEVDYSSAHNAREDAQSMVIHRLAAEGAPKVACANLQRAVYYPQQLRGTASVLSAGVERGYGGAQVTASMIRRLDATTSASITVAGLMPTSDYAVHVHNLSCQTDAGGGHYKFDDSQAETLEDNEIWLNLRTDASGSGGRVVVVDHMARPEAQSMVVHDATDGERVICIDFD